MSAEVEPMEREEVRAAWSSTVKVAAGIVLLLQAATLTAVVSLATDVAEIRGNRFTSGDGLQVWKEIAAIQSEIAGMPHESPAPSVTAALIAIKKELEAVHDKVEENSIGIVQLQMDVSYLKQGAFATPGG